MSRNFFISYARRDSGSRELAQKLSQSLRNAGAAVFIDTSMAIGTDWSTEIGYRIDWCDYFVILISESVRTSEMVQAEVRQAYQRSKEAGAPKFLPIRVGYQGPLGYELDSYLGKLQYGTWEGDGGVLLQDILTLAERGEDWGERTNGASTVEASPMEKVHARPEPAVDLRAFAAPGGALPNTDPFYLERQADAIVRMRAQLPCDTLVIKALRQMGKSSLLARYLKSCTENGKQRALIDLSILSDADMQDYGSFLTELASWLLYAFGIEGEEPPGIQRQAEFIKFMERVILPAIPGGGVIAFDEVDRILGRPYQADFFSMLRLWHNSRATFDSVWERLSLALVISTEPYLLINAADRSPFNVTPPLELEGFGYEQCIELNHLYGSVLSAACVEKLFDLLSGHPYLTRLAYYHVVSLGHDIAWILEHATDWNGAFGDHLKALLFKLSQQPGLLESMRQVVRGSKMIEEDHFHRLKGAGLVWRDGQGVQPANRLYAGFFRKVL